MKSKIYTYRPQSNFNQAIKKLSNIGIRPTKQRMILAKLLFENGDRHISAEEIFDELKKDNRKISLATIYNTLKQFTDIGLLREINIDQKKSIYCTNHDAHYHLLIEDENKIIDIPQKNIEEVLSKTEEMINTENLVRKAIREGEDPQKAYLKYGIF